jgi:hypothetical protein
VGMAEVRRRRREYWAGLGAAAVTIGVLATRTWPVPTGVEGSVLDALLRDRVVVGAVRLVVLVVALYGIASVPALIVGGRWAKGVGTSGFFADEPRIEIPASVAEVQNEVAALRLDKQRLIEERDALLSLLEGETRPD